MGIALFLIPAIVFIGILVLTAYVADGDILLSLGGAFCAVLFAVVAALPAITYQHAHYNERTITCNVTEKDRGGDDGSYRIYTEECGQLVNTDSIWRGKYDSADLWQEIKPGNTYEFHVAGWRLPFFSHFPNVIGVKPAS